MKRCPRIWSTCSFCAQSTQPFRPRFQAGVGLQADRFAAALFISCQAYRLTNRLADAKKKCSRRWQRARYRRLRNSYGLSSPSSSTQKQTLSYVFYPSRELDSQALKSRIDRFQGCTPTLSQRLHRHRWADEVWSRCLRVFCRRPLPDYRLPGTANNAAGSHGFRSLGTESLSASSSRPHLMPSDITVPHIEEEEKKIRPPAIAHGRSCRAPVFRQRAACREITRTTAQDAAASVGGMHISPVRFAATVPSAWRLLSFWPPNPMELEGTIRCPKRSSTGFYLYDVGLLSAGYRLKCWI